MNEAQFWLAVQGEVQDEAVKLKQAMEVSLQEQQAVREAEEAAAPPLVNLSEERLRKRFGGSPMLLRLSAVLPGGVLFSDRPPLREQVKHKVGSHCMQHSCWLLVDWRWLFCAGWALTLNLYSRYSCSGQAHTAAMDFWGPPISTHRPASSWIYRQYAVVRLC